MNYTAEKKDWETVIKKHVAEFGDVPFNIHTETAYFSEYLTLQASCYGVRKIIQTIENYGLKNGEEFASIIKKATGEIESMTLSLYGENSSVYKVNHRHKMYDLNYDANGNFISGTDAYDYEINSLQDLEGFNGEQFMYITEEDILNFKIDKFQQR